MEIKTIQALIRMTDGSWDIAIHQSEMYRAYLQLDMIAQGMLNELCFWDGSSSGKIYARRSQTAQTILEDDRVSLSDNDIDCIKQIIMQCHMNPYDAAWLHYDFEADNTRGEAIDLCMRFCHTTCENPR